MYKRRQYIWCQVELMDGQKEWYCISRVLREALQLQRKTDPFWKNKLIGCYLNVARSYYHFGKARIEVAKVLKIRLFSHRPKDWHWTRNQFVTPEHLLNFKDAYHYLKHDYTWYNRFSIWHSLMYWHLELEQKQVKKTKKKLNQIRGKYFFKRRS